MADTAHEGYPSQQTQPKGINPKTGKPYEPVEIPVPSREEFLRNLEKVAPKPEPPKVDKQRKDG
jgi:hypothetical protein